MGKKIFGIYLAKLDAPNSEAHARLELPASPLELHDAMDKVQLQENEELYLEIDDYYGFEYLAPHLMELDASLNELNDLAGRLAVLDETEQEAFDGLLRLEIQRKVESNGSILTMQDLRTLAVSAGADCCHVVGATSDAELGRFYAENGFMEELDGLSDDVFEMLDFGKIGKALRTGETGTFTRNGYVVQHSELVTAPPCAKELPEKPEYLFRLTLGLHPDLEDDRTVTLELPASAEALREVQKQLGADGWEGAMVLDYDGIIPQAAEFADLPMELDAFNDFAEAVEATAGSFKKDVAAELETALSVITTAYLRTENFQQAVEENVRYLHPPVQEVFQRFLMRIKHIDPDMDAALVDLKAAIDNEVWREWCDAVMACQTDRSLTSILTPIVSKLSDMRVVNAELENLVFGPRKEFITMAILVLINIPLVRFINKDWYHTLVATIPGQMVIAVCLAAVFVSFAFVVKLTQPIEYRR